MCDNVKFEKARAEDGIHDGIEPNEYYDTNIVVLALIGASVLATIVAATLLALI